MSKETDEFLHGLYEQDTDQHNGPYVNWTRGFEATDDEYADYRAQEGADRSNDYDSSHHGGWRSWDRE
jgi:hypothetical protein